MQPQSSTEQRTLLWCIRVWVAGTRHKIEAERRIKAVFDVLGAPDASPYLEGLMFAVGYSASRALTVQCVCCRHITPDELLLLDAVALAQERRPFEALLALRNILSPQGARAALRSAEGLGAALARAAYFLPTPTPGFVGWESEAPPTTHQT